MSSKNFLNIQDESATYGSNRPPRVRLSTKPQKTKHTISESYLQLALQQCKWDLARSRQSSNE